MADLSDLRLTVRPPARFIGEFQYSVLRRQYGRGSPFAEVEGGARERLHDAIAVAEQTALRLIPQGDHEEV